MLNWEKKKEEIPQKQAEILKSKVVKTSGDSFFIDDEEMFVASRSNSNVDEEYYVVLWFQSEHPVQPWHMTHLLNSAEHTTPL